jgi:hypothetical protein
MRLTTQMKTATAARAEAEGTVAAVEAPVAVEEPVAAVAAAAAVATVAALEAQVCTFNSNVLCGGYKLQ